MSSGARAFAVVRLALLGVLALSACTRSRQEPPPASTTYLVRGVWRETAADGHHARISHEAIPGYMEAMTMEFEVPNAADLTSVQPGDPVSFRLNVTEKRGWIDGVQKLAGAAPQVPAPPAAPFPAVELTPGAQLPDATLIDQLGHPFTLQSLRGETLALTFIFTRCPYPDYCPRLTSHFEEVQRQLSANAKGPWRLLSVTIDPAYDTPPHLAAYAERYHADPSHWLFATGELAEIRRLTTAVGLLIAENGGPLEHTLRTVVVDPEGKLRRLWPGNAWTPQEVAEEMRAAMRGPD